MKKSDKMIWHYLKSKMDFYSNIFSWTAILLGALSAYYWLIAAQNSTPSNVLFHISNNNNIIIHPENLQQIGTSLSDQGFLNVKAAYCAGFAALSQTASLVCKQLQNIAKD